MRTNAVLGAGDKYDEGAINGHSSTITVPLIPVGTALYAASMDGESEGQ